MSVSLDKSIWSEFILEQIVANSPYITVANKDFSGEAALGKTVVINQLDDFTASNYVIGTNMAMSAATFTSQSLTISQQKYVFKAVDQLYSRQYDVSFMQKVMTKTADVFAQAADAYLAGLYTAVSGSTLDITSGSVGWTIGTNGDTAASSSAYNAIVKLNTLLDENNASQDGRWCIIPAWMKEKLILDTRFGAHVTYLQNGQIQGATVNGTTIYYSNNVPSGWVLSGVTDAFAFASGLTSLQLIQPEAQVADAVKALYVYGGKVIKTSKVATLHAIEY